MKELKDIELTMDNPYVQEASKITKDWIEFLHEVKEKVVAFHDSAKAYQEKSWEIFEGDNVGISLVESQLNVVGGALVFLLAPTPKNASLIIHSAAKHIATLERSREEFPDVS